MGKCTVKFFDDYVSKLPEKYIKLHILGILKAKGCPIEFDPINCILYKHNLEITMETDELKKVYLFKWESKKEESNDSQDY